MANFGERIAYWYLRLQGFLLVEDFVMHSGDLLNRTADADLLAVRLKYSAEKVSGQLLERDEFLDNRLAALTRNAALIVQVKTGRRSDAEQAFSSKRLVYAIQFLGIVPDEQVRLLARKLEMGPSVECDSDWKIAKLLIAKNPSDPGAINIPLKHALKFICRRLRTHRDRKAADRMYFHDELMQFLAWSASNDPQER